MVLMKKPRLNIYLDDFRVGEQVRAAAARAGVTLKPPPREPGPKTRPFTPPQTVFCCRPNI